MTSILSLLPLWIHLGTQQQRQSIVTKHFYITVKDHYKHFTRVNATESKQQSCDKETEAMEI